MKFKPKVFFEHTVIEVFEFISDLLLLLHIAVTQTLVLFVKMFNKAREENERQAEAEKKKLEKEALKEKAAANVSAKKEGIDNDKSRLASQIHKHLS